MKNKDTLHKHSPSLECKIVVKKRTSWDSPCKVNLISVG